MRHFLLILLVVALAMTLLLGACAAACGVAVVSVAVEEGPSFVAPVPLVVPRTALWFAPSSFLEEAAGQLDGLPAHGVIALGTLVEELADVESAVLVDIREGDNLVQVAKEAEDLVILVREGPEEDGSRVVVRWPIRSVREAAANCVAPAGNPSSENEAVSARCDLREMARAILRRVRSGAVEVHAPGARVDISMW